MNLKIIKQYPKISLVAISAILFLGLLFVVRGVSLSRATSPLLVTQKVRNLSAQETVWQVATTAAPGDVLEYFALVQLPNTYQKSINNLTLKVILDDHSTYRDQTLASRTLGINSKDLFSSSGLVIKQIKSGEFIDLKWQTRLKENVSFNSTALPILNNRLIVQANQFNEREAKTVISLYSTQERKMASQVSETVFYVPAVLGMNPRQAYDDLGSGVLIAGEDLAGVQTIRLSKTNKTLAWRLISNELIEAGIPAGLGNGDYLIEFLDKRGNIIKDRLAFKILTSERRATVVRATPSIVRQGSRRTIVLQGIYLSNAKELLAKNGATFRLENINQINDRVLSAEIPANIKKGEYKLFVGEHEQDIKLTVN